jgi:ABC-type glycerol-3-phosphate transport system permease component
MLKLTRTERAVRIVGNVLLMIALSITVIPFVYMLSSSLMTNAEFFGPGIKLIPKNPFLGNYVALFQDTNFTRWFFNSVVVAVGRTGLAILLSLLAGYAFAKFDFAGKNVLFVLVIATLTLPVYVIIVPLFNMMTALNLTDRLGSLIIPFAAQAIGVFLARQYLLSVPDQLIEAARVDGASEWGIFWRVVLPISQPVIAVMGILFFTASWNDFLWPLVSVTSESQFTVSLGLPSLMSPYNQNYGGVMAGSFLGTVPIMLIFIIFQRRFIDGIMAGSLKG